MTMLRRFRLRPLFLLVSSIALLASSGSAAFAQGKDRALTNNGDLLTVRDGRFGELFPGAPGVPPNLSVLALDVDRDGEVERLLVPGTDTWRPEHGARVTYDAAGGTAILLWSTYTATGTSSLHFTSFSDDGFTAIETVQAGDVPLFFETPPHILVTEDSFRLELAPEEVVEASRKIFHLVWREADGGVHYLPLVFVEGHFVGWSESLNLSAALQQAHQGQAPVALAPALRSTLAVQTTADGRGLLVTFAEGAFGRIATLRIDVRPMELSLLGDQVRDLIFQLADLYDPEDLEAMASGLRGHIIIIGSTMSLNPAVVHYLADQLSSWLLANGGGYGYGGLENLGNDAQAQTLTLGGAVYASTVADPADPDQQVLDLDLGAFLDGDGNHEQLAQLLDLSIRADYPAPAVPGTETATVFPSQNGRGLLVAWDHGDAGLGYVENDGGGWGLPLSLSLGPDLDTEGAYELLRRKAR